MHFNITGCGGISPLLYDRCNAFGDDIDNYLKPTIILFYTLGVVIVCIGVCKLGIPITQVAKRRFKKKIMSSRDYAFMMNRRPFNHQELREKKDLLLGIKV